MKLFDTGSQAFCPFVPDWKSFSVGCRQIPSSWGLARSGCVPAQQNKHWLSGLLMRYWSELKSLRAITQVFCPEQDGITDCIKKKKVEVHRVLLPEQLFPRLLSLNWKCRTLTLAFLTAVLVCVAGRGGWLCKGMLGHSISKQLWILGWVARQQVLLSCLVQLAVWEDGQKLAQQHCHLVLASLWCTQPLQPAGLTICFGETWVFFFFAACLKMAVVSLAVQWQKTKSQTDLGTRTWCFLLLLSVWV